MTIGVNGSTQQRLKPNQSVPALIPLDRLKNELTLCDKLIN